MKEILSDAFSRNSITPDPHDPLPRDPLAFRNQGYISLEKVCDKCKKPVDHIEHHVKCLHYRKEEIEHLFDERGYKKQWF